MVYRPTARTQDTRAASKTKILNAAAKLFATKGYEATTMQDIVKAARSSIGNVYFYFGDKETLLRSVVEASSNTMFDAAERHTAHIAGGAERVGAMIALNTTNFLVAHRNMLRMITADSRLAAVQAVG